MARVTVRQSFRFVVVGALNTALGLTCIIASMSLLGFAPVAANAFGYLVGLFTSFVLNRRWTFNDSSRLLPSLVRFVQVVAVAYLFNLGAMWIVWRGLDADPYAAQVFGTVIYVTTFFVGSKFFVFRAEAFRGEKETL